MDGVAAKAGTRRLSGSYLDVASAVSHSPGRGGLCWVGCHGGAGVSTLQSLTGVGVDAGRRWPAADGVAIPVVLVCRATAAGTAAAAVAVEQWLNATDLRHVRLLGLAVVAGGPHRMPPLVKKRLALLGGWVRRRWFVGWQDAYVACDGPRQVGPSPAVDELRAHLTGLAKGARL